LAVSLFAAVVLLAGCGHGAAEHRERGAALLQKGECDAASGEFNEAIRLDPDDAEAHRIRGDAWEAKRDNDKAIADYDESIRLDPTDNRAASARAILVEAKLKSAALAPLDDAVRLNQSAELSKKRDAK
jgi:tetratricopeptide (TPR) repeat protein